jgi:hypothetical protein
MASLMECTHIAISQDVGVDHIILHAGQEGLVFAQLARGDSAFGASAAVGTSHKHLLWIIADKGSEDQVTSTLHTITTHHWDPCLTIATNRA